MSSKDIEMRRISLCRPGVLELAIEQGDDMSLAGYDAMTQAAEDVGRGF
jgi:hypothetical protein